MSGGGTVQEDESVPVEPARDVASEEPRAVRHGRPDGRADGASWAERVDPLLFEGEAVLATLPAGANALVGTTHRLLVVSPDAPGANFAAVDRPNVESVAAATDGRSAVLAPAARALVLGVVMLGAGATVSFDGLLGGVSLSGGAASAAGLGDVVGLYETMRLAFTLLDDALLVLGALGLTGGLALVGHYLRSRERTLVVAVAGGDDRSLPAADVAEADLNAFRRAFHHESVGGGDGRFGDGDATPRKS